MLGFRVWDNHTHTMNYHDESRDEPNLVLGLDGSLLLPYALHHAPDNFIGMQATGLKADDDEMIFEGDILEISHHNIKEYKRVHSATGSILEYAQWRYIVGDFTCKIVGNIYENRDLLQKLQIKCQTINLQDVKTNAKTDTIRE